MSITECTKFTALEQVSSDTRPRFFKLSSKTVKISFCVLSKLNHLISIDMWLQIENACPIP